MRDFQLLDECVNDTLLYSSAKVWLPAYCKCLEGLAQCAPAGVA